MRKTKDTQENAISLEHTKNKREKLQYISDLLRELTKMAGACRQPTLEGLLDLAHTEAELRSKDSR